MFLHVANAENADEGPDNGYYQVHDDSKIVNIEGGRHLNVRCHFQLEVGQGHYLQECEQDNQRVAKFEGNAENNEQQCKIGKGYEGIDLQAEKRLRGVQVRSVKILKEQESAYRQDDPGCYDNGSPNPMISRDKAEYTGDKRHQDTDTDQNVYHLKPPFVRTASFSMFLCVMTSPFQY